MLKICKIIPFILAIAFVGGGATAGALKLSSTPSHPAAAATSEISSTVESTISIVSSDALSSVSSAVSSQATTSKGGSNVDTDVAKINDATSQGIKKINDVTSTAVEKVQNTASSVTSVQPKVLITDGAVIKFKGENGSQNDIETITGPVVEQNKYILVCYGGHFGNEYSGKNIKSKGLLLKDSNGKSLDFSDGGDYSIKVPYTNLADISTLYFCLADQQIKITVAQ